MGSHTGLGVFVWSIWNPWEFQTVQVVVTTHRL